MLRSLLLATALALVLVSCSSQSATVERTTKQRPPLTYISLGDSLAVGVGASKPARKGYAPILRDRLSRDTGREVRLIQLGESGESSASFVAGYRDEETSQLARAEKTLKNNPSAIVTLSIGGNDLLRTAGADDAARREAISRYGRNLERALKTLKRSSRPAPRIAVLALYNPAPGSFTDEWSGRLNEEIRATAHRTGVAVAAGDRAFEGHESEYTHYVRTSPDIHPTDRGYEALADAFARTFREA